ncbi:unnamed protein product [Effrenium voratum]|uniref:Uncharacterized protein n=1 Tax=Effrenium voratum TaxID=2562239 RepID=A0AA36NFL4_9DINO|nr:unnamed protein product [Effrenium voratum]
MAVFKPAVHIQENLLPLPAESVHNWWEQAPALADPPSSDIQDRDVETMRRSEMLEVCVQTMAVLQLCFSGGSSSLFRVLPRRTLETMTALAPMVSYLLRPRREDPVAQQFQLGPQRMEAFVRRPDEMLQKEVYKAVQNMMPMLPGIMGWATWKHRPEDVLMGEKTGGAHLALQRDLEIPPFIVGIVLKKREAD